MHDRSLRMAVCEVTVGVGGTMSTFIDSLSSLADPVTSDIAERLGESSGSVAQATPATFATILAGMIGKMGDSHAFHEIFDLISGYSGDSAPAETADASPETPTPAAEADASTSLLNILFGEHWPAVTNGLASVAGFRNASSAWSLLSLLSPIALGFLARSIREDGLDATGLANELLDQKASINAAAPPGLMKLLSSGEAIATPNEADAWQRQRAVGAEQLAGDSFYQSPKRGWVPGLVAVLAVILLWFGLAQRSARRARVVSSRSATVDTVEPLGGRVVDTSGGEVSSNRSSSLLTLTLPTGVLLHIPQNGIEWRLVGFIRDSSQKVNDTTWFEFDRVRFAKGSATLTPDSHEQLNNIASILHAYPNVSVKVGGYTDNQGSATANRRLSQRRANTVKQELFRRGIPGNRLQAEGYGEDHPIADNSTESGRAENRRIALRITSK